MRVRNCLFLILLRYIHVCVSIKYHNYTLFRGIPVNESHLYFFTTLDQVYDVNFWRQPGALNKPIDFVIRPEDEKNFLREATDNGIYLTTLIKNIQQAFDKQTVKTYIRRQMDSFNWQNYYRIKDIYNWLEDLRQKHPKEMKVESIGKTYRNKDIMSVQIILKGCLHRSKVIVEGGIHAREWISPAFVTYMINEIINSPKSQNLQLKMIGVTYEWYFVPVINPDGYEYSHTKDRLWRKNRHDSSHGVDLNRNFGNAFGTVGVSFDKNSDIYCGTHKFSEKETKALADFVKAHSDNLEYYLGFHSYGQYMIIPYAHTKTHLDNFDVVKKIATLAASKIAERSSTKYTIGTAYDTVGYMTSGVSGCWVKRTFRTPYVLTMELRDDGKYGFALPPDKILPTCQETMDGMISLLSPKTTRPHQLAPLAGSSICKKNIVIFVDVLFFIIVRFDI